MKTTLTQKFIFSFFFFCLVSLNPNKQNGLVSSGSPRAAPPGRPLPRRGRHGRADDARGLGPLRAALGSRRSLGRRAERESCCCCCCCCRQRRWRRRRLGPSLADGGGGPGSVGRGAQALGEGFVLNKPRASEAGASSSPSVSPLLLLSLFLSFSPIDLSIPFPSLPKNSQNTCVDACNGLQPPAWHVDARQLAW